MNFLRYMNLMKLLGVLLFLSACGTSTTSGPTAIKPPTRAPTVVLTQDPSSIETSTATPPVQPSPTNTTLPPLPDFPEVLTFGGAGGPLCDPVYPSLAPDSLTASVAYGRRADLCILLESVQAAVPLRFHLSQIGSRGIDLWSDDLVLVPNVKSPYWRHTGERTVVISAEVDEWGADGSAKLQVTFWWPVTLPPGVWRMEITRDGLSSLATDFTVSMKTGVTYMSGMGSRLEHNSLPQPPAENRPLMFAAANFRSGTPVYVLLYEEKGSAYRLLEEQRTFSDDSGFIGGEIATSLEPGAYILYGIADPDSKMPEARMSGDLRHACHGMEIAEQFPFTACDEFTIWPSSCPGAPPQRMEADYRGYVCTKGDPVRLRNDYALSAKTMAELPLDTPFTVIDGPFCAENSSWWRIQLDDGEAGWVSEGADQTDPYFICPAP